MRLSRRQLLRNIAGLSAFGLGAGGIEAVRKLDDYVEQQETWREASRPNADFFQRHAAGLQRLTLGASFAPEQWALDASGQQEALQGVDLARRGLGIRQMRLGLRWSRVDATAAPARVDLTAYARVLEYCFGAGVDVCLNVGPIRVFRWPEEHLPPRWASSSDLPRADATIQPDGPLARAALDYVDRLFEALHTAYGEALGSVSSIQIENEPYYPLGRHRWQMTQPYMEVLAARVLSAAPDTRLLVTSAGRLNLDSIRLLFESLLRQRPELRERLISGFDFHYRTPKRQSYPLIRYLDQVAFATPFAPSLSRNIWDARDLGFGIEVSEGQMEPFAQFQQPGNSARDLRYLLLRCLGHVLDPDRPALIRLWGIEELAKRMLHDQLTDEHRAIIEIIQHVNATSLPRAPAART